MFSDRFVLVTNIRGSKHAEKFDADQESKAKEEAKFAKQSGFNPKLIDAHTGKELPIAA